MGLGVDGTVIADGVDLLALASNFGDSVALGLLELLNELVHDIDEDDLRIRTSTNRLRHYCWDRRKGALSYLKARLTQFLTNEASANVSSTEVDSFESHDAGQDSSFVIGVRVLILYECRKFFCCC